MLAHPSIAHQLRGRPGPFEKRPLKSLLDGSPKALSEGPVAICQGDGELGNGKYLNFPEVIGTGFNLKPVP